MNDINPKTDRLHILVCQLEGQIRVKDMQIQDLKDQLAEAKKENQKLQRAFSNVTAAITEGAKFL